MITPVQSYEWLQELPLRLGILKVGRAHYADGMMTVAYEYRQGERGPALFTAPKPLLEHLEAVGGYSRVELIPLAAQLFALMNTHSEG